MKKEIELIRRLERFDTPTVTNAVATYPEREDVCLGLYSPWETNWYADSSLRCMYPTLGARAGYVVTAIYGLPTPGFSRLSFADLLEACAASEQPVVVAIEQDFPEAIKNKIGLSGGMMTTALKQCGVTGVISNGPSRDYDEIAPMGVQYMLTGLCAGHGGMSMKAVNVPVDICGMQVCPGEIVHMDSSGTVKFPANRLEEVVALCEKIAELESRCIELMRQTNDPKEIARIMKERYHY